MFFETGHLYHIYNRGNNSQQLFFNRENYLFFLKKIKKHVLPHVDILAWCLMPNHFHLMVQVNEVEIAITGRVTLSHSASSNADQLLEITHRVTSSHPVSKVRTLNESIAIMLRSYTRAIQKQEQRTGSLFQMQTKATCLTLPDSISPAWFQTEFGAVINVANPGLEYPQVCFNYIHLNPMKDGLVKSQEDGNFHRRGTMPG